jgi:hypothetical protein
MSSRHEESKESIESTSNSSAIGHSSAVRPPHVASAPISSSLTPVAAAAAPLVGSKRTRADAPQPSDDSSSAIPTAANDRAKRPRVSPPEMTPPSAISDAPILSVMTPTSARPHAATADVAVNAHPHRVCTSLQPDAKAEQKVHEGDTNMEISDRPVAITFAAESATEPRPILPAMNSVAATSESLDVTMIDSAAASADSHDSISPPMGMSDRLSPPVHADRASVAPRIEDVSEADQVYDDELAGIAAVPDASNDQPPDVDIDDADEEADDMADDDMADDDMADVDDEDEKHNDDAASPSDIAAARAPPFSFPSMDVGNSQVSTVLLTQAEPSQPNASEESKDSNESSSDDSVSSASSILVAPATPKPATFRIEPNPRAARPTARRALAPLHFASQPRIYHSIVGSDARPSASWAVHRPHCASARGIGAPRIQFVPLPLSVVGPSILAPSAAVAFGPHEAGSATASIAVLSSFKPTVPVMTLAQEHLPVCESILSRLIGQSSSEVGTADERAIRGERLSNLLTLIRDMLMHFTRGHVGHSLEWIESLRKWQARFLHEYDVSVAIAPLLPPVIVQSSRSAYVSVSAWTKLREIMDGWHREVIRYIHRRSCSLASSSSSAAEEEK